jgi:hypothetical protein
MTLRPFHRRARRDEKLVELFERFAEPTCTAGGDSLVERFLRGIEVMHDDQGLGTSLFEGHGSDVSAFATLVISPDEVGGRCHFKIPAKERHRRLRGGVAEHETVGAPRLSIGIHEHEGMLSARRYPGQGGSWPAAVRTREAAAVIAHR